MDTQLIMDGTKFLSMIVENMHFLDALIFLPKRLNSIPKSFDPTCKKGYFPTFLIRPRIWNMWVLIPNPDYMSGDEGDQIFEIV
jgi:hypothetical protein